MEDIGIVESGFEDFPCNCGDLILSSRWAAMTLLKDLGCLVSSDASSYDLVERKGNTWLASFPGQDFQAERGGRLQGSRHPSCHVSRYQILGVARSTLSPVVFTTPTAPLASHMISNGNDQSGLIMMGAYVNSCFSLSKPLMHSLEKLNGASFTRSWVRILQISQENGQNRTNTNTGTEEHTKSWENAIK
ncbi:hypothetical protein Tco_0846903, partial [Tanacetum coccineum]